MIFFCKMHGIILVLGKLEYILREHIAFKCITMSLMWSSSEPICCTLTITCTNTEEWFLIASAKLIKDMSRYWDTPRWWTCVARLLFRLSTCVCVDHDRVHNVFLYWEIFSKLDFKQTWVHLMRCWSGVQVCDHKTGWRGFRANDIDARNCFVEVSSWCGDEWFRSPVMLKMRVITGIPAILAFQCDSAKNLNPKDWIGFMYTVTYSPHLHFYFSFHVFQ